MTILPFPPRRAWLRAFWLVVIAALAAGVLAGAVLVNAGAAIALVPLAAVAAIGWRWPRLVHGPYRAWNGLAVRVERALRLAVLLAAYHAVIVPCRSTRTLALQRPAVGESRWEPYPATGGVAYFHPYAATADGDRAAGWVVRYAKWALSSGNAWMVALLPFLWLLAKTDTRESQGDVPTDIYTLA